MNKHTAVPWTVNGGDDVWIGDRICIYVGDEDDARLIAAAPELLKALIQIVESDNPNVDLHYAIEAINKARGTE